MRPVAPQLVGCILILCTASFCLPRVHSSGMKLVPERWREHLRFLGSDELAGRGVGSEGAARAAEYLADRLSLLGLKPLGDEGFYQPVPMRGSVALPGSQLVVRTPDSSLGLVLNRDYLLYRLGAETFVPAPVPVVFAGYGIVAPEFDYNSYQDLDVSGKIVAVLTGEPASDREDYFSGTAPTIYSNPESKHRLALSRGARGTILIPNPLIGRRTDWKSWVEEFAFEDVTLAYGPVGGLSLLLNPAAAGPLFQGARHSLRDVFEMDLRNEMESFELASRMSFHGEFHQREFVSPNVVGLIEGSDARLRDRFVLLSAHYDGLGLGPAKGGDAIYNGVFDNAAGVSTLLELAAALAAEPPARSVVVLFTTGEEKGMLGARYYAEHPAVPLYRTVANINIDGVASFDTFRDLVGVGGGFSTLGRMLEEYADSRGLSVSRIASELERSEAFTRSDQLAFAEAGIPSLLILDGLKWDHFDRAQALARLRTWMTSVYHSPFDDLSQPIEMQAVAEHFELLLGFARFVADAGGEPEWRPAAPYVHARLQSIAERR